MAIELWRKGVLDLKEFGYFSIFQILAGSEDDRNFKFIYVKFDNSLCFQDYESLDEHCKIRSNSELYKSIEFDMNSGNMTYYESINEASYGILMSLLEEAEKLNESKKSEYITSVIKEVSNHIKLTCVRNMH